MSAGINGSTPHRTAPRFSLGKVVATPAALELLKQLGVNASDLLRQHQAGAWGDLSAEDKHLNDQAVQDGSRILSSYRLGIADDKVWIITDGVDDSGTRRCTTILTPRCY